MPQKIGGGGRPLPYEKSDGRYIDGVGKSQDVWMPKMVKGGLYDGAGSEDDGHCFSTQRRVYTQAEEKQSKKNALNALSERTFSTQVDDVIKGKFPRGNAVYVGVTPKILQDVGLNGELPMLTTAKHIKKAVLPKDEKLHNHGLTVEQLKSIPRKISHPVMIMDSLTEANSVVIVTNMIDCNDDPIVVVVKADGKGMYNNVETKANFMLSYYPKANFHNFIEKNIKTNSILFIDKEKSRKLSNQTKVQFFGKLVNYDFDIIIRKSNAFVNI